MINLSADKDRVLAEAFRVLKPGGRVAVSDVVVRGEMPPEIRRSVELWVGCISGALDESVYVEKLTRAGFVDVSIEPTRVYRAEDAREFLNTPGHRHRHDRAAGRQQVLQRVHPGDEAGA